MTTQISWYPSGSSIDFNLQAGFQTANAVEKAADSERKAGVGSRPWEFSSKL